MTSDAGARRLSSILEHLMSAYEAILPPPLFNAMARFAMLSLLTHPGAARASCMVLEEDASVSAEGDVDANAYRRICDGWVQAHDERVSHELRAASAGSQREQFLESVANVAVGPPGCKAVTILRISAAGSHLEAAESIERYGRALLAAVLAGLVGIARHRGWGEEVGLPLFRMDRASAIFDAAMAILEQPDRIQILNHYVDVRLCRTTADIRLGIETEHQRSLERLGLAVGRLSLS